MEEVHQPKWWLSIDWVGFTARIPQWNGPILLMRSGPARLVWGQSLPWKVSGNQWAQKVRIKTTERSGFPPSAPPARELQREAPWDAKRVHAQGSATGDCKESGAGVEGQDYELWGGPHLRRAAPKKKRRRWSRRRRRLSKLNQPKWSVHKYLTTKGKYGSFKF